MQSLTTPTDNRQAIVGELVRMFAVFPVQDQSREGQEIRLEGYLDAVGDFPPWAVERARVKIVRGLVPEIDRAFAPTPGQLAEVVRETLVQTPAARASEDPSFDGEVPMTWIRETDPRWDALCAVHKRENPKRLAFAMTSKHAEGRGWFFQTRHVDEVGTVAPKPPRLVMERARVIAGFKALNAELAAKGRRRHWSDAPLEGLAKRAQTLGVDFDAAMGSIPDAPPRSGTFDKLKG